MTWCTELDLTVFRKLIKYFMYFCMKFASQNRDYNRSPTSVGTFDVNGAAYVASRILAAILLASKNGGFDRVLLGSSLQKLDYQ